VRERVAFGGGLALRMRKARVGGWEAMSGASDCQAAPGGGRKRGLVEWLSALEVGTRGSSVVEFIEKGRSVVCR
jgi:hypothetical protein